MKFKDLVRQYLGEGISHEQQKIFNAGKKKLTKGEKTKKLTKGEKTKKFDKLDKMKEKYEKERKKIYSIIKSINNGKDKYDTEKLEELHEKVDKLDEMLDRIKFSIAKLVRSPEEMVYIKKEAKREHESRTLVGLKQRLFKIEQKRELTAKEKKIKKRIRKRFKEIEIKDKEKNPWAGSVYYKTRRVF